MRGITQSQLQEIAKNTIRFLDQYRIFSLDDLVKNKWLKCVIPPEDFIAITPIPSLIYARNRKLVLCAPCILQSEESRIMFNADANPQGYEVGCFFEDRTIIQRKIIPGVNFQDIRDELQRLTQTNYYSPVPFTGV